MMEGRLDHTTTLVLPPLQYCRLLHRRRFQRKHPHPRVFHSHAKGSLPDHLLSSGDRLHRVALALLVNGVARRVNHPLMVLRSAGLL